MWTEDVIHDLVAERHRQDEKWGQQDHDPFVWLAVIGEEFGEASESALKSNFSDRPLHMAQHARAFREELVQLAAVTVAAIEAFDRAMAMTWVNESEQPS